MLDEEGEHGWIVGEERGGGEERRGLKGLETRSKKKMEKDKTPFYIFCCLWKQHMGNKNLCYVTAVAREKWNERRVGWGGGGGAFCILPDICDLLNISKAVSCFIRGMGMGGGGDRRGKQTWRVTLLNSFQLNKLKGGGAALLHQTALSMRYS